MLLAMSPNNTEIDVCFYAPKIGNERLSAPDYCLSKLIRSLTKKCPRVRVQVVMHPGNKAPQWLENDQIIQVKRVPYLIERCINKYEPDIVHLNRYFDLINPHLISSPIVLTYHGDLQWEFPELIDGRSKAMLACSAEIIKILGFDEIVFVSNDLRQRVEQRYSILSLSGHTIYNGVDHDVYKVIDGLLELQYNVEREFILHVSNLTEKKNPEVLLKSYAQVAEHTNIDLVICGGGWKESDKIDRIISHHGLDNNVHRLGYVPEKNLVKLYNTGLILVFPSVHETFGLPVVEAMACGIPVITSDVYSIPEVVGDAALLSNPFDVDKLSGNILRLIHNDRLRRNLRSKGLIRVEQFDWEYTKEAYLRLYKSVVST